MLLINVETYTWVSYRGEPYYIHANFKDPAVLRNCNGKELEVYLYSQVEPVEIPQFNVGDKVMYIGEVSEYKNKFVTITNKDNDHYIPYRIDDKKWVTPFNIVSVDY